MAMDMKDNYVVGMGEVLWDVFGDSKRLGGAPANFAYHASRFGHEGLVVSAVGNDTDGDDIVAELDRKRPCLDTEEPGDGLDPIYICFDITIIHLTRLVKNWPDDVDTGRKGTVILTKPFYDLCLTLRNNHESFYNEKENNKGSPPKPGGR